MEQEKPIFIGGLPRSGTSMVRAIVSSHPDVALLEYDIQLWTHYYVRYQYSAVRGDAVCKHILKTILRTPKMNAMTVKLDENSILSAIRSEANYSFPLLIKHILKNYADLKGKPRWGLKTPYNEFFVPDIFRAFPDAKFVHVIRDPRDVAVSAESRGWEFQLTRHRNYWEKSSEIARRNESLYPNQYIAVYYEELLQAPEAYIHRLCQTLELDFREEMVTMQNFPRRSSKNSSFSNNANSSGSAFYSSAAGRFQKHLTPVEIAFYQQILEKPIYNHRYPLVPETLSSDEKRALTRLTLAANMRNVTTSFLNLFGIAGPTLDSWSAKERALQVAKRVKASLLFTPGKVGVLDNQT